jgi:hypothetical protein
MQGIKCRYQVSKFRAFALLLGGTFLLIANESFADQNRTADQMQQAAHLKQSKEASKFALKLAKEKLIWDFTSIAFSNTMWLENDVDPFDALAPFEYYLEERQKKPTGNETWVGEYINRSEGIPGYGRIVKWTKPISIAIGWPYYGFVDRNVREGVPIPALVEVTKAQIEKLMPELKILTGLPVDFVSPNDPREKTPDYPRIRIVFLPATGLANHFKVANMRRGAAIESWSYQLNSLYIGAIPFTPHSAAQVDGFLLPNADNSLGLSVCRILDKLPEDMIRGLISECLVRAMGLPEMSRSNENVLTGSWNHVYEPTEKLPATSGISAFSEPHDYNPLPEVKNATAPPQDISDYDKRMLSLLYCPAIKAGSDKYSAIVTLLSDQSCIKDMNKP